MEKNTVNLRDTAGNPERARYRHLARSGSQSTSRIRFILPAHGASHITNSYHKSLTRNRRVKHVLNTNLETGFVLC